MLKKLIVLTAVLLSIYGTAAMADTGTYKILDYQVALVPHSNGTVEIQYYQKWQVTGGHIPWITVGVPNSDYTLGNSGYNVKVLAKANNGSWSGVRLDLDKDYGPTEVFEISFSITQNRLFYADKKNYRLDFVPGWYDRATIDSLTVKIKPMAKIETVTAKPKPTQVTADTISWKVTKLAPGKKFEVGIAFPKTTPGINIPAKQQANSGNGAMIFLIVIIVIFAIIVLVAFLGSSSDSSSYDDDDDDSGYSGGRTYYAGSGSSHRSTSHRSSSGGGGFGGRTSSCHCACVSCACACACASGSGAGCSRKTKHTCPACQKGGRNEKALVAMRPSTTTEPDRLLLQ